MNAHSFAMLNLFIAFGFAFISSMGIFSDQVVDADSGTTRGGIFALLDFLNNPVITIPGIGFSFNGVVGLAIALAALTIIFLNTNLITDKGASMVVYSVIFFGSVFTIGLSVFHNINYVGIELFYGLYVLVSTLAFLYMLVQMSSGGHKGTD